MHTRDRRRRFIAGALQRRLLVFYFVHAVIIVTALVGALFVPAVITLNDDAIESSARSRIASEFLLLHGRVWPALLVVLVTMGVHAVVVTHRVAGPMVQIIRAADEAEAGNWSHRLHIRRKDYLNEEVDAINRILTAAEHRIETRAMQPNAAGSGPSESEPSLEDSIY